MIYHAKYNLETPEKQYDDKEATLLVSQHQEAVKAAGGEVHVSRTDGYGPSVIVLQLPEGVTHESVFPGPAFERFLDGV